MPKSYKSHRTRFLARVQAPDYLVPLLDHLSDVAFWVKDRDGRFMLWNRALVQLVGARDDDAVLGRRDDDFFPLSMAENFMRDDQLVLKTGQPLYDRMELVRNPADGSIDWFSTTKIPLRDRAGSVIGLAGYTRDLKKMKDATARFLELSPVVDTIMNDYARPLSVAALADKMSLSLSQFERQWKRRFQVTPRQYINQIRIKAACHLLANTDLSMADIARQTGFYDQSHFAHQFVRLQGTTPSGYRRGHARAATGGARS